jgi:hypothetical protein
VKKNKVSLELIDSAKRHLDENSVELIDFDELKGLMTEVRDIYGRLEKITGELQFLKGEYRSRIVGMLKAVTACRCNDEDVQLIKRLGNAGDDIKAEELVKLYDRTAAGFRTCFPFSFKYLTPSGGLPPHRDWREHKI